MFFNDRTGELHIRATRREIPKLERAIAPFLRPLGAPIRVEVHFAERTQWSGGAVTFAANLGTNFTNVSLLTPKQFNAAWSI
jgi:hypothetical protein